MRIIFKILLVLMIVGGAGFVARSMILSTETAAPTPKPVPAPEVDVAMLVAEQRPALLTGTGVVEAARQLTVVPEVSGRIVYQSPALTVGGRVKAGEVLVRLDRSAYELTLRQQRSQVEQAKLERELESGRGKLAEREWALLQGTRNDRAPGRLASRQAQAEAAEVGVDAAQSALERAQLDLRRTVIRAPFDATVTRESVEVGQVVGPGNSLATLVGTGEVWARVALPVDTLRLLRVPTKSGDQGSKAVVIQQLVGGGRASWEGAVDRLVYELETESRMLQLLVAVPKPFDIEPGELPLLPGAFVTVEIRADVQSPTVAVPRKSLFEGRRIWTVDTNDKLASRELNVLWGDSDRVFADASGDLSDGMRVVLEPPVGAVEGMKVVPREAGEDDTRSPTRADVGVALEGGGPEPRDDTVAGQGVEG